MDFVDRFLSESKTIIDRLDRNDIEKMADLLRIVRDRKGRLFFIGVGGGAANASHAVNDFRKIAGFEAYAPTDNVAELTARINDDGWDTAYANWLEGSRLAPKDGVFVFSVGGGSLEKNISANIVRALDFARSVGAAVFGVVGRDGGYVRKTADASVVIPPINPDTMTPQTEAFQALVWHCLISHPKLRKHPTKWESVH